MSFERCEKQRNPVHLQRICGVYIHANNDTEKRIIVRNYYIMPVIFCQQYCHYYQQKIRGCLRSPQEVEDEDPRFFV